MQHIQTAIANVDTATHFPAWGPDANPLIRHFKHQQRHERMTLRGTLWVAFILGMLMTAWATWDVMTLSQDEGAGLVALLIYMVSWPALIISPLFSAISAARQTSDAVRPERYELVYISPLPNQTLIGAHIFRAIYYVRRQWALIIATAPFLVIYTFYVTLESSSNFFGSYSYTSYTRIAPDYWTVVGPSLWVAAMVVGFWGLNLLGTVFGVRMGLFRRGSFYSTLTACSGMILLLLSPCACCMCATALLRDTPPDFMRDVAVYVFPVGFMIAPWIAAWVLMQHTALIWQRE